MNVTTTHIDCWDHSSATAILTKLLAGLGETRLANTPSYELVDTLRNRLEHPYIVILDGAGQIADDNVLKTLHKIPEVTLMCIVNEYRPFLRSHEMGIESWLEEYTDIEFEAYTEAQLQTIFEGRIEHGVADGVVPDEIMAFLSEGDRQPSAQRLRGARPWHGHCHAGRRARGRPRDREGIDLHDVLEVDP
ncbi:hypothetical protein HYG81_04165 [Natrinema zhouii]|uniref:Orc1/cdc6 family replication initiation protein n=1 Tax=Natrinema zhouii TaxID=1710539 RepID=A0A7D6CQW3_9EURY|nr:orc1/cdc6 family replication initiation protein [Natrinema zhouii]QLK26814.1 hypothetical protein HYG81_04165 [Natrinema zhouii]